VVDNPVKRLNALGQSPWLDFISRKLVRSCELDRLIERWGLGGVTSNPVIFEKAIVHSSDYDADIRNAALAATGTAEIYESLVLDDIRGAADAFAAVYRGSNGANGYVSLEVSPHLVDDSSGTVAEGERLWTMLDRPNVMIKVPGTVAGLAAIEELTALGINVNGTLLFSLQRYRQVVGAFLRGLERVRESRRRLESIASVASFFLSRIDTMADAHLERIVAEGGRSAQAARELRGEVAIACARGAYVIFRQIAASKRCQALARGGARMQRLLWASTGTKNPEYDDIKYVEPMIGPQTVSTMPLETLEAYERHGKPAARLTDNQAGAREVLSKLHDVGIDLEEIADRLLVEGIDKFVQPFDATHSAIERKRLAASASHALGATK
jgi:transaldolase